MPLENTRSLTCSDEHEAVLNPLGNAMVANGCAASRSYSPIRNNDEIPANHSRRSKVPPPPPESSLTISSQEKYTEAGESAPKASIKSNRRKSSVIIPLRENKAMRAAKAAALKRREKFDDDDVIKYGQTNKQAARALAQQGPTKKHTFLRRSSISVALNATNPEQGLQQSPRKSQPSPLINTSKTDGTKDDVKSRNESNAALELQVLAGLNSPLAQTRQQQKKRHFSAQKKHLSVDDDASIGIGGKGSGDGESSVRVVVRKRPANDHEMDCIRCEAPMVFAMEPKKKVDLT